MQSKISTWYRLQFNIVTRYLPHEEFLNSQLGVNDDRFSRFQGFEDRLAIGVLLCRHRCYIGLDTTCTQPYGDHGGDQST